MWCRSQLLHTEIECAEIPVNQEAALPSVLTRPFYVLKITLVLEPERPRMWMHQRVTEKGPTNLCHLQSQHWSLCEQKQQLLS